MLRNINLSESELKRAKSSCDSLKISRKNQESNQASKDKKTVYIQNVNYNNQSGYDLADEYELQSSAEDFEILEKFVNSDKNTKKNIEDSKVKKPQ